MNRLPRHAAEATLHRVLDTSREASLIQRGAVVHYVSPAFKSLLGYEAGDFFDEGGVNALLHPDDHAALVEAQRRSEAGEELPPSRARFLRKDGSIIWADCVRTGIDYLGAPAIVVRAQEITYDTELALPNDSQKTETIALAGAIAHDFNNILSVILAVADAMLLDLGEQHSLVLDLREIESAARRAIELTHQLATLNQDDQRSTRAEKSG